MLTSSHQIKYNRNKGFTLFVAITLTGTLLLISTGIVSLALKQSYLSSSARESQHAFYAADTGAECALYWDVKNPQGYSSFSTTTASTIYCNRDGNNGTNQFVVGGTPQSSFIMTFLPEPYCAEVIVSKLDDGTTRIESNGYNTCDTSSSKRVQRSVRATY